ncbi:hypothetical protein HMPREF0766_12238 [Sphingobacterium spiritivorum ATCC 33861]|uniref:Uncharacterized protein n=1 Tax=Sphingobacterium spiritivorum ATCC 33861 TaxID=525373 RepID=D7VML8_SPHSI|nr:hypothetical protein HMPREF0766_12238 [Sphingobacterium spiritivorum ATCC 33861]
MNIQDNLIPHNCPEYLSLSGKRIATVLLKQSFILHQSANIPIFALC